jgi:NitT/TauT family transport system permease protein
VSVIILVWQALTATHLLNPYIFPTPLEVVSGFSGLVANGSVWGDTTASVSRVVVGFFPATAFGLLVGLVTGGSELGDHSVAPVLNFLRAIPSIAMLPFALAIFGVGEQSKIALVFWGALYPVWLSVDSGVRRQRDLAYGLQTQYRLTSWQTFLHITLPGSFPYVVIGMRVGIALAFLNLVAAEMSGASAGLGYRITISHQNLEYGQMVAMILCLGLYALLSDRLLEASRRWLFPWSLQT